VIARALIVIGLATSALCVWTTYDPSERPLVADNQYYYFQAERFASGVSPHVSTVDVKTQIGTMLSGSAIWLGRLFGVDDVLSARVATALAAAAAVALAWLLGTELTGNPWAALVGAAVLLATQGLFLEAAIGASVKVFMVAFALAANLLVARRRYAASAVVSTLALLTWQPSIVILGGCGLATLVDRRARWSDLVAFLLAVAGTVAVYEVYFLAQGSLSAQLVQEWVVPGKVIADPFDLVAGLRFIVTESFLRQTVHVAPVVFLFVAAVVCIWGLARPSRSVEIARTQPGLVAFWSTAAVAIAWTLYDHQSHPDMLLIQPYSAIACTIATAWLAVALGKLPGGSTAAAVVSVAAALAFANDARRDAAAFPVRGTNLDEQRALAKTVDIYRDHRGSVWVIGALHLLAFNHLDNHVSHGYIGTRLEPAYGFATWRPLRDGRMPEIIVVTNEVLPGRRDWLAAEYQDITTIPFSRDHLRVFSRRQ
jgi:hypothetical protein